MHTHAMYRSERIREIREARALTQTQLAKLVGTTQPTISRIEKGEVERRRRSSSPTPCASPATSA